jgi:peptide/nickel transport system ATP-binding protein
LLGTSYKVHAAHGVNLEIAEGESVALVGESGSGKSTLARIAAGLLMPDAGSVTYRGTTRPQMVYQDAFASLTPWLDVEELIGERLRSRGLSRVQRRDGVIKALGLVGLPVSVINARPAQLSVGQCQRVAIARAIVLPPPLLVCDEAVSAMDVSLAAGILNLLGSLRRTLHMAILFITHDLAAARFVSDRIVVLKDGRVVESGAAEEIIAQPRNEYTRNLLASVPQAPSYVVQ